MPPDAPTLGFDTSAAHCAAAVVLGDRVLALRDEAMATGQAERLLPLLDEVLAEAGCGWPDVGRIGVGVGPGNFTGTRIAVGAARGLALGLGIPAIGVGRFEAAALGLPRPLAVVEDARRGEVHVLRMNRTGASRSPGEGPVTRSLSDLSGVLGGVPLTGSAAAAAAAVTGGPVLPAAFPLAVAIARIAAEAALPQPRPAPVYLRPPDAAPPRAAPPVLLP